MVVSLLPLSFDEFIELTCIRKKWCQIFSQHE